VRLTGSARIALFATCLADARFPEAQTRRRYRRMKDVRASLDRATGGDRSGLQRPSPYSAVIASNRCNATNRSCLWSTIGDG